MKLRLEENTPESTLDHGLPLDTEEIESTPDIPAATKETKDDIISNDGGRNPSKGWPTESASGLRGVRII